MLLLPPACPHMGFFTFLPSLILNPRPESQPHSSRENQDQVRAAAPVSQGERLRIPKEMAAKGPVCVGISSLPPHQHQGHSAAFAPQKRRNIFSWVQVLTAGWQGRSLSCILCQDRGAEKSPAAKALAPAQCGLSPSLMDAAAGEEGSAISPRAMGRWGTGYSLIWNHEEPAPPQQKSRGGLKLASTRLTQTIFIFKRGPRCALLSRERARERTDHVQGAALAKSSFPIPPPLRAGQVRSQRRAPHGRSGRSDSDT